MRSTFAVRETASLGQQMLNAPLGINGLTSFIYFLSPLYTGSEVWECIWNQTHLVLLNACLVKDGGRLMKEHGLAGTPPVL